MRKTLTVLVLSIMALLVSCATGEGSDKKELSSEREKNAVMLLSLDMIIEMEDFSVNPEILSPALSKSFTFYSNYVPSYKDVEKQYLEAIAEVATDAIKDCYPLIKDKARELAENPLEYIVGDTSLSDSLQKECGGELDRVIYAYFQERSEELDAAFTKAERIFLEIRTGYANLSAVGKGEELPLPEEINLYNAAIYAMTSFFSELGSCERVLKNTPASAGSLYTVFWE